MTFDNEHEWIRLAADELILGGQNLQQAMCAVRAKDCLSEGDAKSILEPLQSVLP
jgi:hypothetical protein